MIDINNVTDIDIKDFIDYYKKSKIKIPNLNNFPKTFEFMWRVYKYNKSQAKDIVKTSSSSNGNERDKNNEK